MSTDNAADNPLTNPHWLLFDINAIRSQSQWLYIPPKQRKQLPFMDQRLLEAGFKRIGTPLAALSASADQIPDGRWIFHAGHCGSTLLAQILGDNPQTNALREPQVLRTMASLKREAGLPWHRIDEAQWQEWLMVTIAYLGRPTEPAQQQMLLKATSHCNNLIDPVLALPGQQRLLLLSVALPVYLATMLGSAQHLLDIDGFIQAHMQDLIKRFPELEIRIPELNATQKIAITWLTHMLAFLDAVATNPQRVLLINFEHWLEAPDRHTATITNHLGMPDVPPETVKRWLGRYSKDPARPYSPDQRHTLLTRSTYQHADQILAGRLWLEQWLRAYPEHMLALRPWLSV